MIASIITENELYKLHHGFKKWYGQVTATKATNYFNLCHKYYLKTHSLNQLIKLFYKGKQTFYNWSNKIKEFFKNSYSFEWFKNIQCVWYLTLSSFLRIDFSKNINFTIKHY
ncbi:hypothetical protein [Spiroplasma sp. SV19]|uniref:hypothetical protein n=1 Tax=Spiroplasma sp. SV19 TaxID=2570468 RepID=UPI0024B7DFF1|nr:hypothetical protein [Spiroplasma sp. SV19]